MGDLIDLKSPDGKTVVCTKLASPLIPVPTKTSNDEEKKDDNVESVCSVLNFVKRDSLDNNPFDNAVTKIVEYARKQDDPFEVVLQKALTNQQERQESVVTPKARNVGFKDDFTPKRRRYSDILKMNKTLDESLVDTESEIKDASKKSRLSPKVEEKPVNDSNEKDKGDQASVEAKSVLQNTRVIPTVYTDARYLDTSILNLSVMNDSLTESSGSSEDNLFKSMITHRISERIRDATADIDWLAIKNDLPKSHKSRRSLSQSDKLSPRKLKQHRSRSILEGLKIGDGNGNEGSVSCAPSILFEDNMNKAFVQSQYGTNASAISNLSNISAITRLTSCSSGLNSSYSSNRTANCAFIESSGEKIDSFVGTSRLGSNGSVASMTKSPVQKSRLESDLDDLISKYAKLRTKSSQSSTNEVAKPRLPSIISGSGISIDKSVNSVPQEKLIDVDVFVPESNESPPLQNTQRQSLSSDSSDSVFIDDDTNQQIFSEAKNLAKTFEELAHKTSSSTSTIGDDLINSRPHWNFDLLPVSDDEDLVGNLIDLPKSPGKNEVERTKSIEESQKLTSSSEERSEKSIIKELESEFIDPEKKIIASTLLSDLEKLVLSENNPKAVELLKSLEKALGAKCGSNAELLETCFSTRNDLTKSPKKVENSLNIREEIIEKSREDNTDVETSESFKELSLSDGKNLENNLNIRMDINKSDKSLIIVNENSDENSKEHLQSNSEEKSSDKIHDDSIDAIKQQNTITDEQKIAVELLVGLGKLLTGENKDPLMKNLLKNLGKALNLASLDDANVQSTVKETRRTPTRIGTPPRKSPAISAFSRTANRRSLESGMKTRIANERGMRRSISTTQTPTSTTSSTPRHAITPLSADKSKAHLKEIRKRFSSDPGVANPTDKKKFEIRAANDRNSSKDIPLKPVVVSELTRQDKPSSTVVGCVKTKLRKKAESDVATKKGPMKAILPLGNMQRRGSLVKKIPPLAGPVTPPKPAREVPSAFSVTTSTPFPIVHLSIPTKSPKSKPMASSTPDDVGTKNMRRSISQIPPSPGKNSFMCNISPVTSKKSEMNDEKNSLNDSKSVKPTKIVTPSKSRTSLQLPKMSPVRGSKTSPKIASRGPRRSDSHLSLLPRSQNALKSPREKISSDGSVTSPLKNSNILGSKVKPLNLISKLRGRNASVNEKENCA